MTRVIDPLVADMQWQDADTTGAWRRGAVRTASYVAFWRVLAGHVVSGGSHSRTNGHASAADLVGFTFIATALTTMLLVAPPLIQFAPLYNSAHPLEKTLLLLYVIPQAAVLTLPYGLLIGALGSLSGRSLTRRVLKTIGAMTSAFVLIVIVMVQWLVPSGNQAFRELSYEIVAAERNERFDPPQRGLAELTGSELRALIRDSANQHLPEQQSRRLQFQYHVRGAISAMPIACAVLGVTLSAVMRRRAVGGVVGVVVALGAYSLLHGARSLAVSGVTPPALAAWASTVAMLLLSAALIAVASLRPKSDATM